MMTNGKQLDTRIAVLGTLAEFHREPIPYNIQALIDLVVDINPDLLCLDMSQAQWNSQDLEGLPPEYREALLPLANQTDIVVVPVGDSQAPSEPHTSGWRGRLIDQLRAGLAGIQRGAPGPDAINHGWRHDLANLIYHLIVMLANGGMYQQRKIHTGNLSERVIKVSRDNPGSRILVVVNVQYCHHIRPRLRQQPNVKVVKYTEL